MCNSQPSLHAAGPLKGQAFRAILDFVKSRNLSVKDKSRFFNSTLAYEAKTLTIQHCLSLKSANLKFVHLKS